MDNNSQPQDGTSSLVPASYEREEEKTLVGMSDQGMGKEAPTLDGTQKHAPIPARPKLEPASRPSPVPSATSWQPEKAATFTPLNAEELTPPKVRALTPPKAQAFAPPKVETLTPPKVQALPLSKQEGWGVMNQYPTASLPPVFTPSGFSSTGAMNQAPTPLAMSPAPLAMSAPLRSATTYAPDPAPLRHTLPTAPTGTTTQKNNRLVVIGAVLGLVLIVGGAILYFVLRLSAPNVIVYQVGAQSVNQSIGGGGIVFPRQRLDIAYPIAERAVNVFVKPGDQVTLNQPLIQLDPAELTVEIKQASNEVAAAQANLQAVSNSGNGAAIAQAQQSYNLAKGSYNALIAEASSPLLHHGALISPMNGVVVAVNVNTGEVFPADTTLITIIDESAVFVHTEIPLANVQQVHLGQSATVTPSALPNLSFQGTVSSIIPQADPQTDTFEVWIKVANPKGVLFPGMSAFVRIQAPGQALVVPRLAVLNPDSESIVFVVRGQRVYIQHVQIVGRSATVMYVGAGLSAGDKVVVVGLDTLQDGQNVYVTQIEGQTA